MALARHRAGRWSQCEEANMISKVAAVLRAVLGVVQGEAQRVKYDL